MALFASYLVAFTQHLRGCVTPNLESVGNASACEMVLEDIERLKTEPSIDHDGGAIREVSAKGKDRLIASLAELPVVFAVAGSQMSEEGLLNGVKG